MRLKISLEYRWLSGFRRTPDPSASHPVRPRLPAARWIGRRGGARRRRTIAAADGNGPAGSAPATATLRCWRRRADLRGGLEQVRQNGRRAARSAGCHRHALMGRAHEAGPDFHRQAAAGRLLGRRVVVIAEPDAGDEVGGVADEPGVAEILAGAGLAGGGPAGNLGLARGAGRAASPASSCSSSRHGAARSPG